jgi:hypothetical protein
MALARVAVTALFVGATLYLLAIQYWLPSAAPLLRTKHHEAGIEIPSIGIGTWLSDRDKVAHAVQFALESGYNHVDAALIYSLSIATLHNSCCRADHPSRE